MEKQVIEYAGVPVGISVPEGNRVKFIAVKFPVIDLDGGIYSSVADLQRAIRTHMKNNQSNTQDGIGGLSWTPSNARNAFSAA
ncbi:hypothetical protein [Rhizobium oryziradicis]|uniref:hypothetical protein n=1 Tax=Rhizobium oryziradicis TaxID=1867956 RepID=UPI00094FABB3|nr:hypothetical protein [Rhizobium oryziradicis]